MNAVVQSQLNRLETALTALSESITAYNPSAGAAQDLVQADIALRDSLEQLAKHQANHARLEHLRALSDSLDKRFVAALTQVADTRRIIRDLPSAPALSDTTNTDGIHATSSSLEQTRAVRADDLLTLARNAARFAAPMAFAPPQAPAQGLVKTDDTSADHAVEPNAATSGKIADQKATSTTSIANAINGTPVVDVQLANPGLAQLSDAEIAWLDPDTQTPFLPWPSEGMIARSGLARSQNWAGAIPEEPAPIASAGQNTTAEGKAITTSGAGTMANADTGADKHLATIPASVAPAAPAAPPLAGSASAAEPVSDIKAVVTQAANASTPPTANASVAPDSVANTAMSQAATGSALDSGVSTAPGPATGFRLPGLLDPTGSGASIKPESSDHANGDSTTDTSIDHAAKPIGSVKQIIGDDQGALSAPTSTSTHQSQKTSSGLPGLTHPPAQTDASVPAVSTATDQATDKSTTASISASTSTSASASASRGKSRSRGKGRSRSRDIRDSQAARRLYGQHRV